MTFDLFGGRRLLLAGSRLGGFWVAAGVLALVLLVVLYREERRLVSRRAGLGLLGLRLAAAAVLVLALFEPIAAQTFHTVVKGRVFVALDVSESMATADPHRPAEERARLAASARAQPRRSARGAAASRGRAAAARGEGRRPSPGSRESMPPVPSPSPATPHRRHSPAWPTR